MGADEDRAVHLAESGDARLFEQRRHAVKLLRLVIRVGGAGQVVERQHGVGLAAAEVGLEPDHRIAALAGEPHDRGDQDAAQAFRRIGDTEERGWVRILFAALALIDVRQVGGELCVGEARFQHVRVGLADLPPGAERGWRRGLLQRRGSLFLCRGRTVGRALFLIELFEDGDLRFGASGGEKLAHGVEVAQRLARIHASLEVRGSIAGVHGERDEAPRLPDLVVEAEQFAPVVEQRLQQRVDIELAALVVTARAAGVVAPVVAVAVPHVLRHVGPEADSQGIQPRIDPPLRCARLVRVAHHAALTSIISLCPSYSAGRPYSTPGSVSCGSLAGVMSAAAASSAGHSCASMFHVWASAERPLRSQMS